MFRTKKFFWNGEKQSTVLMHVLGTVWWLWLQWMSIKNVVVSVTSQDEEVSGGTKLGATCVHVGVAVFNSSYGKTEPTSWFSTGAALKCDLGINASEVLFFIRIFNCAWRQEPPTHPVGAAANTFSAQHASMCSCLPDDALRKRVERWKSWN